MPKTIFFFLKIIPPFLFPCFLIPPFLFAAFPHFCVQLCSCAAFPSSCPPSGLRVFWRASVLGILLSGCLIWFCVGVGFR